MTCVACSSAIENALMAEFGSKGMEECKIILLTHKMKVVIKKEAFELMAPSRIVEEVEAIGFGVSNCFQ